MAGSLKQKCIEVVTAGSSWKRLPRVGSAGGVLSMTYAEAVRVKATESGMKW